MKKMKKGTVQFIVLILIILEYIYIPFISCLMTIRLNPYYTGIHLHVNEIYKLLIKKVLILIILEYIYMKPH